MSKKKRFYEDDDGRTIADMSGIEPQPLLIPRIPKRADRADFAEPDAAKAHDRPWDTGAELSREERNAAIRGALKAGILIALAFLAGGALLILAMQVFWGGGGVPLLPAQSYYGLSLLITPVVTGSRSTTEAASVHLCGLVC